MAHTIDESFFRGKRPWSKIKDKVLQGYMPPYLRKVSKLGKSILLVDGYAGPGTFEEDSEEGSPLIMCKSAETHAADMYHAIFVNQNPEHHRQLYRALSERGWLSRAKPVLGDASHLLDEIAQRSFSQTVFLYLDPFGLKGCEFDTLKPFLSRSKSYSTEIVLNVSMPITHRLAAAKAEAEGKAITPRIASNRQRMTEVFGGEYWKDIFFSKMEADEKENLLMTEYRNLIGRYLPSTGSCPVREKSGKRVKYFITFASRHVDALLLMNDEMCKAYNRQMHAADFGESSLFHWQEIRPQAQLDNVILDNVARQPGRTRADLWHLIVQQYFMQYTQSEYRKRVQHLVKQGSITVEYTSTGRLNDQSKLWPTSNPA